jgi:hypothetical protein
MKRGLQLIELILRDNYIWFLFTSLMSNHNTITPFFFKLFNIQILEFRIQKGR